VSNHRHAKRTLYPVLYAASVPLVLLVFSLVVGGVYASFGNVSAWATGVALVLGNGIVLVLLSSYLTRLERPKIPGISEHLLHCAVLYAGLVALEFFLVPQLIGPWCCTLQWSIGAGLFASAAYAVALDACTVYAVRRKTTGVGQNET
jgi:hypothetical protein